jgi:predicted esterase
VAAPVVTLYKQSVMSHRSLILVVSVSAVLSSAAGSEGADFVPFFYNYGINTIILRNRLRNDGYVAETDAVNDMLQAIKVVRARAQEWGIDPKKIGAIGFSAGAELTAPAAIKYVEFDKSQDVPGIRLRRSARARISSA